MKSIQKFTPKTNEFLTALRNLNQDNYKASPKLERSPSDRGLTQDKVDLSSSTKLSESESFIYKATPQMERSPSDRGIVKGELSSQNSEKEYVSVVISSGDPKKRSALLSANTAGSQEDKGIPKNLKIDRTLSSGDIVARVDKKLIGHLEGAGFKVTNDEQQFVLPIMPGDSSTKSRVRKEQPAFTSVMKLDVVNASTRLDELKTTGKGISIAILDTGVAPHPDIENKIVAFKDFVNDKEAPYDDNGHGTHVAGDAAGTGVSSGGKYKGTAPDASIVGVKVLNNDGGAKVSDIIEGIDWVIQNRDKYNIRIINMSIGVPSAGFQFDPIDKAVERAVNAGIVVVAAAGNEGPKMGTIGGAPGNSPLALTVGAIDDKNTIDKSDDEIAPFSSRGPTMDGITKPDLVAPGTNIISLNIKDS